MVFVTERERERERRTLRMQTMQSRRWIEMAALRSLDGGKKVDSALSPLLTRQRLLASSKESHDKTTDMAMVAANFRSYALFLSLSPGFGRCPHKGGSNVDYVEMPQSLEPLLMAQMRKGDRK